MPVNPGALRVARDSTGIRTSQFAS